MVENRMDMIIDKFISEYPFNNVNFDRIELYAFEKLVIPYNRWSIISGAFGLTEDETIKHIRKWFCSRDYRFKYLILERTTLILQNL